MWWKMKNYKFESLKLVKRGVIVDTDIGPDCDDVGALVILFAYAKKYNIPILGIANCTSNPYGCGAVDVVSKFMGYDNVAIGMWSGKNLLYDDDSCSYNKFISEKFSSSYAPVGNKKADNSLRMYRKLLSDAKDDSVILITIGTLNNIAQLIESKADDISSEEGITLIKKKVHAVVTMAGCTENKQREFNVICDADSAQAFFEKIPVPVIYSGFELGAKIDSGFNVKDVIDNPDDNPIFLAYKKYTEYRRMPAYMNKSFDLTAVHFAFEGEGEFYKLSRRGKMVMDRTKDDSTEFVFDNTGNSYFIDLNCTVNAISNEFSNILKYGYKKR